MQDKLFYFVVYTLVFSVISLMIWAALSPGVSPKDYLVDCAKAGYDYSFVHEEKVYCGVLMSDWEVNQVDK